MVLDDHHSIVRLILQEGQHEIHNFIIGSFHFKLLQVLNDSWIYRVRLGNFSAIMFFLVVDADVSKKVVNIHVLLIKLWSRLQ